jgi:3-phosphoshikimate 1-carboxyvinyltransferase
LRYRVPVPSAQVKTALLFAGLYAEGETEIEEGIRTRDHGEIALRAFGVELVQRGNAVAMRGRQKMRALAARIPGDLSSAAFFLCATALFPGAKLALPSVLLNPTRARLLEVLIALGLRVSVLELEETHGELVGTVEAEGGTLTSVTLSGADTAALIDEIPVLAAIAPYTAGGIEIRDAAELRVKESDRIRSLATNLRAMGAELEERPDGLRIPGGQRLHGAELDSFGDHRIAMAFAVAALRAEGDTQIKGAEAAVISYPAFYSTLESLVAR